MVLDEVEDQRLHLVPVGLLFLGDRDEVFAVEDVGDPLDAEETSRQRGYFVGLLKGRDVNGFLRTHDDLGSGNELEEVRIGGLLGVDEQPENSPVAQHHFN